jgi:hypothetical protein
MAYLSASKITLQLEFPFLVVLMAYIIRSCDPGRSVDHTGMDLNHTKPNLPWAIDQLTRPYLDYKTNLI